MTTIEENKEFTKDAYRKFKKDGVNLVPYKLQQKYLSLELMEILINKGLDCSNASMCYKHYMALDERTYEQIKRIDGEYVGTFILNKDSEEVVLLREYTYDEEFGDDISDYRNDSLFKITPAFNLEDILDLFPDNIEDSVFIIHRDTIGYNMSYVYKDFETIYGDIPTAYADSLLHAAYTLLEWLIVNGHVKTKI